MRAEGRSVSAIELLILSGSLDDTQGIITSLRNGGLAVHGTRIGDLRAFEEQLPGGNWDLILCCAYDASIDLDQALALYQDVDRDLPLLLMVEENRVSDGLLAAMRAGARDLIHREDLHHLQLVVAREISDLRNRRELARLRQQLLESEQRSVGLVDSSREAIAFVQDGMHVHVNGAYLQMFGFSDQSEIEDLPLLDLVEKDHQKAIKTALKQLEGDRKAVTVDLGCRRQDGRHLDVSLSLMKASVDGEPGYQIIVRDRSRSPVEMEKEIHRLITLDQDTQLPNRSYFMAQLTQRMGFARSEGVAGLVLVSVPNFPGLRRSQGVTWADGLIRRLGEALRQCVGAADLLARFNDNCFALLLEREDERDLLQFADTLKWHLETEIGDADPALNPECGIGVVLLTDAAGSPEELVKRGLQASESGTTASGAGTRTGADPGTRTGQAQMAATAEQKKLLVSTIDEKLVADIEHGLRSGRFRLLYQPIVSLQGDTRENYAVLVRLLDAGDEEILPEVFLRAAEQMGRIAEIDHWVIRAAISAVSEMRRQGNKTNFFINLSESSVRDKNLLLWVFDCLREFGARGSWLTFQIRAKHAQDNAQEAAKLIEGLKKIKCQVALDHFGHISDPEGLLDQFPVDFVKLAPSFSRDLATDPDRQQALSAINEMIVGRNIKSIATAVEDGNSLTVLWTVGISYIQGYFLQEPSHTIEYNTEQLI